jgi:1,4-dihydroxy-2-naphthoate octaprenyltransferase
MMNRWLMIIRAPFLPLSIVLAFLGAALAWYNGSFHVGNALLAGFGILMAHISVDVLNEYFDFKSGIDLHTERTMFNGGSGALPQGLFTARQALWIGLIAFIIIIPIGAYYVLSMKNGLELLPLLVVAAVCILIYSPIILKIPWPEWAPGLGLGMLPVLGAYFVQTGQFTWPAVIASVPSFILVHNLLFLNEFPDAQADAGAGRKTTPILWGKKNSARLYSAMTVLVYLWIIGAVITQQMPVITLIGLLTVPMAVKAIRGSLKYDDKPVLVGALAANVQVVLITQLLVGIGYILSRVLGL